MDKKTKMDLKDILRGAGSTAQGKLDVHGVRDDLDDSPVFDRSKRNKHRLYDMRTMARRVQDGEE